MIRTYVTPNPISAHQLSTLIKDNSAGATVSFSGDVRNHDGGKIVSALTYEIHPSAEEVLEVVVNEVVLRHKIISAAVAHRYGEIAIGECAFAVAVSAAHREAAFSACQDIVNTVKEKLPIWKHQQFADGTDEWVNFA
ncbi:unannotated protein [freshwater metagenome]|uniref:Unannotated protein n=1 Tax=freshwater metagenome TaxID=449393 RepID=A0A6J7XX20_9ZZZZ|nr:molybdenum cofactor biosynthesis protein MoaE [Actinomycetota bacterium]